MQQKHSKVPVECLQKYFGVLEIHNSIGVYTGYYEEAKKEKNKHRMEALHIELENLVDKFFMSCH